MAKGRRAKKKAPFVDIYAVLILVATLIMSIAYAEIVGTELTVATKAEASAQEGVFITNVVCNEQNSVSNNYMATTLDSSITLDSETDTKTFTITIYNKTLKPHVFVGVKKLDSWDEFTGVYNNTNISYTFGKDMVPYKTILPAKEWITFNVELGFNGQGTMPETLRSLLNFSFQEIPTLEVVSEDTIENMYPNCEEQVYEFTVSNQRQDETHGLLTNGVPLTYTIAPNVPAPLTAKIYDKDGTEVATNKAITISSEKAETHTYTMKVKWDNTNPENGKEYNSAEYAGQTLSSSIKLIVTPDIIDDNDKYIGYTLNKEEPVEIKTAPMYFGVTADKTTVEMNNDSNNAEKIILDIQNNDGTENTTNINKFAVDYKVSIDNTKFTLLVDGSETGETAITLGNTTALSQNHEIQLVSVAESELAKEETCNLSIQAISPYAKTETIALTIKDTKGPTAPEITGGSTGTYALEQTISVSEVATDVGTGVNKYQYLLNSTESTETEAIADVITTATSQTFTEDAPGYYVYFRAVDNAGNPGEWSNAQQIYIDTSEPTVSLASGVSSEMTIEEGESNDVASYFTYDKNGNAGIKSVTYTVDGTPIENTDELTASDTPYTIICTVTKDTNASKTASITVTVEKSDPITATTVAADPITYYGASVNYEDPAGDPNVGWKIFHSDGDNVYLIADDYIHYDYAPTSANYSLTKQLGDYTMGFDPVYFDYTGSASITDSRIQKWITYVNNANGKGSTNPNIRVVAFMLDYSRWNNKYRNIIYADYAIGGPTLEMFVASYNKRHPSLNIGYSTNVYGYLVGTGGASNSTHITGLDMSDPLYVITANPDYGGKAYGYWLAAPSGLANIRVVRVNYYGLIGGYDYEYDYTGLRPVVCLKSGVTLEKVGDNEYDLIAPPPATAADVAADPITYYGASVNYEDPAGDPNVGWKIFHSDGDNVYLIADDVIDIAYAPKKTVNGTTYSLGTSGTTANLNNVANAYKGSEDITDSRVLKWISWVNKYPKSTNLNIKKVAYLLDTEIWNEIYTNNVFVSYAVGGPTLELYNAYQQTKFGISDNYFEITDEGYGYTNVLTRNGSTDDSDIATSKEGYWFMSSPSWGFSSNYDFVMMLMNLTYTGSGSSISVALHLEGGLRPVVCLKSDIKLQANADGTYNLIGPEITVKPNQSVLTINPNDSHSFDSLFTVTTATGDTSGVTKTYKLNGEATEYNNTSNLALGEYTLTCTAKLENGASAVAAITIIVALGYTLTFLSQGATVATMTGVKTVSFPEEDPTLTNYKFTGWYYDEASTQIATVGDSITANTTLYAGWSKLLNPNKGETQIAIFWEWWGPDEDDVVDKHGAYSDADLDTIYIYESNLEIESIEINPETTAAGYVICPGMCGSFNECGSPYHEVQQDSVMFSYFYSEGNILKIHAWEFASYWMAGGAIYGQVGVTIHFKDGTVDEDIIDFSLESWYSCLAEGTQITLADRTTKGIEDITYEDDLLVWDFDNARFAIAKPLWIKRLEIAHQYNLLKFTNGAELKTIDQHRIFNKELGKFSYPMTDETPVGTTTFTDSGDETKLVSKEIVEESVVYYNVITDYHMNLFANGILTSCRFSNLYPIENMKYIKDNRKLIPKEEYPNVPDKYYRGLRLAEQPQEVNRGNDVEHSKDLAGYVQNLINKAQPKA